MSAPERLTIEELEVRYESQNDLEARLSEVFRDRDELFLDQMHRRISALLIKESFFGDAIRKGRPQEVIDARAAAIYSWLACAGRHAGVSIQSALEAKFPAICAYCGSMPCECVDATRGAAILPTGVGTSGPRSLRQWQEHLETMYGANNRSEDKGVWFTVFRMMDETGELLILELNKGQDALSEEDFTEEMQLELADATAWLIAACNLTEVDLQSAVLEKYGNGCVKCEKAVCSCGVHYFSADSIEV